MEAPYGPKYDRHDLSEAVTGVLGDITPEELLALLNRHTGSARRLLEWGPGDNTAIMTGFAHMRGAELLVSIDHRAEHLRAVVEQLAAIRIFAPSLY